MEKVLIIDDDRMSRTMLTKAVERLGYATIQSGNGRHGWETLWENSDIKFIITDMVMPDMDGRELVHLIRRDENLKDTPVIIISGCFNVKELEPIIQISPDKTLFMAKPIDIKLLEASIKQISGCCVDNSNIITN